MTKYYTVEYGEPWEPVEILFKTRDRKYAEWICKEYNKLTDASYGKYFVSNYQEPKTKISDYWLTINFEFDFNNLKLLESSLYSCGEDEEVHGPEYITVDGSGCSYEECLEDALNKAKSIKEKLNGK